MGIELPPNMASAVDLSGAGDPDTIDLTKPVTDQQFRKATLSMLNNMAMILDQIGLVLDKTGQIAYDHAAMTNEIRMGLNAGLESMGVLEVVEKDPDEEPPSNVTDMPLPPASNLIPVRDNPQA